MPLAFPRGCVRGSGVSDVIGSVEGAGGAGNEPRCHGTPTNPRGMEPGVPLGQERRAPRLIPFVLAIDAAAPLFRKGAVVSSAWMLVRWRRVSSRSPPRISPDACGCDPACSLAHVSGYVGVGHTLVAAAVARSSYRYVRVGGAQAGAESVPAELRG